MVIEIIQSFIKSLNDDLKPYVPIFLAKRRNGKSVETDLEVYTGINDANQFSGYVLFPEQISRSVSNQYDNSCTDVYDCKVKLNLIVYFFEKNAYLVEERIMELIAGFGFKENNTAYITPKDTYFNSTEIWQRENITDSAISENFKIIEIVCELNYKQSFSGCKTDINC